jgi:hypothetical protein
VCEGLVGREEVRKNSKTVAGQQKVDGPVQRRRVGVQEGGEREEGGSEKGRYRRVQGGGVKNKSVAKR